MQPDKAATGRGSLQDTLNQWSLELLKCCNCSGEVARHEQAALRCGSCGTSYPICNGVPMMLPADTFLDSAQVIADAAGGLDREQIAVALASANRYWLRDPALRGEFSQIISRYGSFFPAVSNAAANTGPALETVAEYFAARFGPGQSAFRSIRIRNNSAQAFGSEGAQPFFISYFLYDATGAVVQEGPRSPLPIDLEPGMELTVPILISAPHQPGTYRIRIMMVHEYVRWYEECPLLEGPLVVDAAPRFADQVEQVPHQGFFDFEQDLAYCGETLNLAARLVRERLAADRPLRILEVACGSDPQAMRHYQPGTQVMAMDLCYPQVQIASLQFARGKNIPVGDYQFLSGDLGRAPIKAGSFDIVVISAALHHFADVTKALGWMRDLTQPGGCVVLLREPSKVCHDDPTYIAELKAGFNEQQFELDEYEVMYARAGLVPAHHKVHFECSYKAVLFRA